MLLPLLVLVLLSQSQSPIQSSYVCGDRDAQTEPLQSTAGFSAFLTMHSEDDHDKNSHECQASYSLHIVHPDGTRIDGPPAFGPSGFFLSDADWNRPLVFRIDGFSPDGERVFVFIAEGGQYPSIYADEFDMITGSRLREEGADRIFLDKLGPACAAALHISGTVQNGHIVLRILPSNACSRTESWQLNSFRRIKGSMGSKPGTPTHIAPATHVLALDPGKPTRPPTN